MVGLLLSALALASFAEAPVLPVPGGRDAGNCNTATGTPGELALEVPGGVRFLRATSAGFTTRGQVDLGESLGCPVAATRPNGAGVLARESRDRPEQTSLQAVARDPGGGWGTPGTLRQLPEGADRVDLQSAVADSGDAVVAWSEKADDRYQLWVARRAPGQPFGPAEPIGGPRRYPATLQIGVAATGESVVMTASVESEQPPLRVPVRVSIAARGAAFSPPVELGTVRWRSTPALRVAADGRALVAIPDGVNLLLAERAPGEGFATAQPAAPAADAEGIDAYVALDDSGAAAVAWEGAKQRERSIITRRAGGAFTPPVVIDPREPPDDDPFFSSETLALSLDAPSFANSPDAGTLTLTGDGHAAWSGVTATNPRRAWLTTVALGGDRADTRRFGAALGWVANMNVLALEDGRPALVWNELIDEQSILHLAAEGATTPQDPPAPKVKVGKPVRDDEDLLLPVTCSGPCDVRAIPAGDEATRVRLTRGGKGKLRLYYGASLSGRVRVRLTYSAINAYHPRERTITLELGRSTEKPEKPTRITGLSAKREGDLIKVRWQVKHPPSFQAYFVTGASTQAWSGEPPAYQLAYNTRRKRTFTVTLRGRQDVRYVTLRDLYKSVRRTVPVS